MHGSTSSNDSILNEATGVEPGCVEIIPLNLVTLQVLTWLYSQHTDTRNFSDNVTFNNFIIYNLKCFNMPQALANDKKKRQHRFSVSTNVVN